MNEDYVKKSAERMESRKSSFWWDNHVSAKNSKWLSDNLEEMNQNVERMMKLIQDDGDSFARRAEMYYKRRPELISHVQEFQHTYQSLAERYTHLIGELRRNITSEVSQSPRTSVTVKEFGSELSSSWLSPEAKLNRFKSKHRAAGFDFFLGQGANTSDRIPKGDESFSVSDSETESDISSVHNYPRIPESNSEEALHEKAMQLDVADFCDEKEKDKLAMIHQEETNANGSLKNVIGSGDYLEIQSKIAYYEREIANLKMELEKAKSLYTTNIPGEPQVQQPEQQESSNNMEDTELVSDPDKRIHAMVEELRVNKGRLYNLETEVANLITERRLCHENIHQLQEQLRMAQKDATTWKAKLETEIRKSSKWQDRISRYKSSLTDRDNEIRELKEVVSDVNKKYQLHAEISRLADENKRLEESLREWEVRCHLLESQHSSVEKKFNDEIDHLNAAISEKRDQLEELTKDLVTLKLNYEALLSERDELSAKLAPEAATSNLTGNNDEYEELKSKVEQLREEVERQKILILDGAEEKREAIRQLCFSLEHYRNGYEQLRQAFTGIKRHAVFAS